jgi:hypothetical protein
MSRVAAIVPASFGVDVPAMPLEDRLARARRELAAPDRETGWSAFRKRRLGAPLCGAVPALRTLGDRLVRDGTQARAALAQLRELLRTLGVADEDLPRPPSRLDAWRGSTPTVRAIHGAYAIGSIVDPVVALGLWDHGTGKRLLVVEGAVLLELVPGRAEVATVRLAVGEDSHASRNAFAWFFERFSVPSGERPGSLVIRSPYPRQSSEPGAAGGLATVCVWPCRRAVSVPYQARHPDRLLDEALTLGRRPASPDRWASLTRAAPSIVRRRGDQRATARRSHLPGWRSR